MNALQSRIRYLLNQYATGAASPAEEEELFGLIGEGSQEDLLKSIMVSMMQEEVPTKGDKDQLEPLFKKILKKGLTEEHGQGTVLPLRVKKRMGRWKQLAVAASLLVVVGAGIVYYAGRPDAGQPGVVSRPVVEPDVAAPASTQAILTLSDGNVVSLDDAGQGALARQGTVTIVKLADGQIAYRPGGQNGTGDEIGYNTLTNPVGSKVVNITLADGTRVWLNAGSSLRYPAAFTGTRRQVEITGEAYFEVARMHLPAAGGRKDAVPFQVRTNEVAIEVLGTHFNINSYPDEGAIRTTLLEGSVKVHNEGQSVLLQPGQQAQVTPGKEINANGKIIKVNNPDLEEVMAWKNGRFSFQDADLESIMLQVARWYNLEVVYEDRIDDRYTVSVSRTVPLSQLFRFIEMSGGVDFTLEGKKVIVRK
ncbi:MAG TPA: FecR domain-containing protein [Chitinophagaceae bacterium]